MARDPGGEGKEEFARPYPRVRPKARDRSPNSLQNALHRLGKKGSKRLFGGRRSSLRCERAGHDLLYLIFDGDEESSFDLAVVVPQIAESLGAWTRVDRVESRFETGRDVFAIRESIRGGGSN